MSNVLGSTPGLGPSFGHGPVPHAAVGANEMGILEVKVDPGVESNESPPLGRPLVSLILSESWNRLRASS